MIKLFIKCSFIFIYIFFLSTNLNAKPRCINFYEAIYENLDNYNLDVVPYADYPTYGFKLDYVYDFEKDDWALFADKDGYPRVSQIVLDTLVEKIYVNDLIISINDEDIRNLDLNEKYLDEIYGDEIEIKLKRFNKKLNKFATFKLKLKKEDLYVFDPFTDLTIRNISINQKQNTFTANLNLSASIYINNKYDLYKIAEKNLLYQNKDLDDRLSKEDCNFTRDKWRAAGTANIDNLSLSNLTRLDNDLVIEDYNIYLYSTKIEEDLNNNYKDELEINYNTNGLFILQNKFDLRSFPFDKQKLIITLNLGHLDKNLASISDYSEKNLKNFSDNNNINGWNITDSFIVYGSEKAVISGKYESTANFIIEVERKYEYYIYKVIIPILLILMICWSSVFISPKELESRLTITIVCLLSLIAYNFVIDSELPKLEYLTVMDWIILLSYIYATIPNFLSIIAFKLYSSNKKLCMQIENKARLYGPLSYVLLVLFIILFTVNTQPDTSSQLLKAIAGR